VATLFQRALGVDDVWSNTAFYNVIQEPVGDAARKRPIDDQWCEARGPYRDRLDELRPDLVIATGKALWERIPRRGMIEQDGSGRDRPSTLRPETGRLPTTGFIQHASSGGFGYDRWFPIVKALHSKAAASKRTA
jgi:hypothetical protein